jgi:hypothetical protein
MLAETNCYLSLRIPSLTANDGQAGWLPIAIRVAMPLGVLRLLRFAARANECDEPGQESRTRARFLGINGRQNGR